MERKRNVKAWIILILAVPLGIYLFYFVTGYYQSRRAPQSEPPPPAALPAGAPAETAGGVYRAGIDYKIAFYGHLKAGANVIQPEPGLVFASVPVLEPEPSAGGEKPAATWVLLDESGNAYPALKTDPSRYANLIKPDGNGTGSPAAGMLLFKVRQGANAYYLKLETVDGVFYWRLAGGEPPPGDGAPREGKG